FPPREKLRPPTAAGAPRDHPPAHVHSGPWLSTADGGRRGPSRIRTGVSRFAGEPLTTRAWDRGGARTVSRPGFEPGTVVLGGRRSIRRAGGRGGTPGGSRTH